jgi:hypothetical protein
VAIDELRAAGQQLVDERPAVPFHQHAVEIQRDVVFVRVGGDDAAAPPRVGEPGGRPGDLPGGDLARVVAVAQPEHADRQVAPVVVAPVRHQLVHGRDIGLEQRARRLPPHEVLQRLQDRYVGSRSAAFQLPVDVGDELVAERSPYLHGDAGILLLKADSPGRVQGRRATAGHGQPALPQRFPD